MIYEEVSKKKMKQREINPKGIGLPAPECLMVKELVGGVLEGMSGFVEYSFYKCLVAGLFYIGELDSNGT